MFFQKHKKWIALCLVGIMFLTGALAIFVQNTNAASIYDDAQKFYNSFSNNTVIIYHNRI